MKIVARARGCVPWLDADWPKTQTRVTVRFGHLDCIAMRRDSHAIKPFILQNSQIINSKPFNLDSKFNVLSLIRPKFII